MSDKEFDPFAPSTGLPDDFDLVVKKAWFEFDPEFNNGQSLVLKLEVETDLEDFSKEGPTGTLLLSCGKGWDTKDRGETAVRDDGKQNVGFHQSTAYFLWIKGAIESDGAEKVLRSAERGDPRKAAMWVGTAWHINRQEVNYGGDIGKKDKLAPTKFLGLANSIRELGGGTAAPSGAPAPAATATTPATGAPAPAAAPAPAPLKKAAPVAAAAPAAPEAAEPVGIPGDIRVALVDIAKACADHEAFVAEAMEYEVVANDTAVQAAVMEAGPGSVWKEAHPE